MSIEVDGEIYEWLSLAKGAAIEVEPTEVQQVEEWLRFAKGDQHVEAPEEEDDDVEKRAFSDEHRAAAAKKGTAMPGGEYPIETPKDLENAVSDYKMGRVAAGQKAAVMAHIVDRAKDMGEPNPFEQEDESTETSDSSSSSTTKAVGEPDAPAEDGVAKTELSDARLVDLETFYYSKSSDDESAPANPEEIVKSDEIASDEVVLEEVTAEEIAPEGDQAQD